MKGPPRRSLGLALLMLGVVLGERECQSSVVERGCQSFHGCVRAAAKEIGLEPATLQMLCGTASGACKRAGWGLDLLEHKGRLLTLLRAESRTEAMSWYPPSFILDNQDDVKRFAAAVRTRNESGGTSRLFCLKPQLGTEGKGIEIVAASQLRQYAAQFFGANDQSVHPRYREYLAQHYINQPLLLGSKSRYPNRKFDFRVHAFAAMRIVERSGVLVPQFWSFFYPALFVKVGAAEYKEEEATKGEHKTAHILNANQATVWMSINQLWDELPQWPDRPKLASGFESELMRQVEAALAACFRATQDHLLQEALSTAVFGRATMHSLGQKELAIAKEKLPAVKWEMFGVDFVVDQSVKASLVDFNTLPGMTKAKALGGVLFEQFKDMLTLLASIETHGDVVDSEMMMASAKHVLLTER